ncbi:hypothetical protein D9M68_941830 [compost metagenome]
MLLRGVLDDVVGSLRGSCGLIHSFHLLVKRTDLVGQRQYSGPPLDVRDDLPHRFEAKLLVGDLLQCALESIPLNAQLLHGLSRLRGRRSKLGDSATERRNCDRSLDTLNGHARQRSA